MGVPMVANLARAGFEVAAWNRTADRTGPLAALGVRCCAQAAEAVSRADVVIVMLSTGPVVDQVLFDGTADTAPAVSGLRAGAIVVVTSSIPVHTAREQARRLAGLRCRYLDAPVSGGERGAIDGTLAIMVGGEVADVTDASRVLATMGRVTHVGPVGSGQLAKLANQLIVGVSIGAVAEALLLAEAGGADPRAVREALLGGFADSTVLRQHGERMLEGNFKPGARAEIQLKDLRTAGGLARDLGLRLPIVGLLERLYEEMCSHGREGLDHSALFLELRDRAAGSAPSARRP